MSVPAFAWAFEQGRIHRLPSNDRLVLIYLANMANGSAMAWPSQETICENTGLAERSVRISTRRLELAGLISIAKRGKSRLYNLLRAGNGKDHTPAPHAAMTPAPHAAMDTPTPAPHAAYIPASAAGMAGEHRQNLHQHRQNLHETPAPRAENPTKNLRKEPKTGAPAPEGRASSAREEGSTAPVLEAPSQGPSNAPQGSGPETPPPATDPQMAAKLRSLAASLSRGWQNNYPPRLSPLDRDEHLGRLAVPLPPRGQLTPEQLAAHRRIAGIVTAPSDHAA